MLESSQNQPPALVHGKTIFTKRSAKRLGTAALDPHEELVSLLIPKAVLGEILMIEKVSRVKLPSQGANTPPE